MNDKYRLLGALPGYCFWCKEQVDRAAAMEFMFYTQRSANDARGIHVFPDGDMVSWIGGPVMFSMKKEEK